MSVTNSVFGRVILLLSSFPLHILFNSTVFVTSYQGKDWSLTIATEAFTSGAAFFSPGASLTPAGVPNATEVLHGYSLPYGDYGYGDGVNISEYWDPSSKTRNALDAIAGQAAKWVPIDPSSCLKEYRSCKPRKELVNVVIIINGASKHPDGWTRSEVYHFNPQSNLSMIWNADIMPPNETNSLWYSTHCQTMRSSDPTKFYFCTNNCLRVLGLHNNTEDQYGRLSLNVSTEFPSGPDWTIDFRDLPTQENGDTADDFGYNVTFNNLVVNHCLAQHTTPLCKIGVANPMVLAVIVCVVVKLITCTVVVWKLPNMSLVTPGDAIESFISCPDLRTEGLGSFEITDSERLEYGRRQVWTSECDPALTPIIRPRRWHTKTRRLFKIIPRTAWIRTYFLIISGLALVITALVLSTPHIKL